ncbi:MAG: sulfatase family protein [Candidatus Dormibacter sp.]|uniref:sulfatase family protein n=1 Tax=Candidatus Dormibacter sp. TaxID=2973982 RepID=UPI003D9BC955
MSRVLVLAVAVLLALASCSQPTGVATTTATPIGHPNIVFVLTDDLSWNLVDRMPHVKQLMQQGVTFDHYYVTDSLCCPSRSSIFRGQFPHNTGIFTNGGSDGGFAEFYRRGEQNSAINTWLHSGGYRTAMMGKYLNGYMEVTDPPRTYVPPGWDEWDVGGNGYPQYDYDLNLDGQIVHYGTSEADYLTDVIASSGQQFIQTSTKAGKPFFLELATFAPHAPYTPPKRYLGKLGGISYPKTPAYDAQDLNAPRWRVAAPPLTPKENDTVRADYEKRVEADLAVDDLIGNLEKTLRETNQLQNTYFVFSSDNGYHMGEHRLHEGKQTAFDTDINVPLVISGPGVPRGLTQHQLVMNIDLAPTFARLGGVPAPDVDGVSLLPLLRSNGSPAWRQAALVEHHGPNASPNDPDYTRFRNEDPPSYNAIRTAQYTYVEYLNAQQQPVYNEIYDDRKDPYQLSNLAGSADPAIQRQLHALLQKLTACHGADCFVT